MTKREALLIRELLNVKGELLLLKRSQRRLTEMLEEVLRAHAGMAGLLREQKTMLEAIGVSDENALDPRPAQGGLKKAA